MMVMNIIQILLLFLLLEGWWFVDGVDEGGGVVFVGVV